ncbi:hypothetical protein H0X06_05345, partial [Candidatus Dependentiae bacterium]|nr:hypothetical protein [Candidatus Dependentiae bacterium]
MLLSLQSGITQFTQTFPYRDTIEVLLISLIIYYILLWLKRDTEKNLLGGIYIYSALFFTVHYFDLHVLRFLLFASSPLVALFFIIIHQETLQKNFVKLSVKPADLLEQNHWIDELMQCCLS